MSEPWLIGETLEMKVTVLSTDPDNPTAPPTPTSLLNLVSFDLRIKLLDNDDDPPLVVVGLSDGWVPRTQTGGDVGAADLKTAANWLNGLAPETYHYDIRAEWNDGTVKFVQRSTKQKIRNAP